MIRALLLALSLATVAAAQNQPVNHNNSGSQSAQNSKSAEITVQGCVNGGERFTLMQTGTGAIFAMDGDVSRFAPYQGKVAEVRGTELPPVQQSASGELPKLQVKDIKTIADKCPVQEQPGKGSTTSIPPATTGQQRQAEVPVSTPRYESPGASNQTPPNGPSNPNMTGATGAPSPGNGSATTPQQPPPQQPPPQH